MKSQTSRARLSRSTALALLATPLFAFASAAAPQIMAVASTDLDIPVTCEGGECSVELSSICLQEHRGSPYPGTAYYVHGDNNFQLTGVTDAGQEIKLSSIDLKVEAARGHNAVKVAFNETALRKYGPMSVKISVPKDMSIVPLPIANDVNPQTEADIELATGPLRQLASSIVDDDVQKRDAAELLNQTINRLPWRGRATDGERLAAEAEYREILATAPFSQRAKANADAVMKECATRTYAGSLTLRQCLGSWHDRLIGKLNTKYWSQLKSGS
ncbi:hypothetical protein NBZ79_12250 [Sneathiella marina]|uniref:Lysozyme inhibitor LprI N-terminal domain-containing protein n=1 Tax=Sneathiella marina TaxID=2950108 RepID=A0ABY4W1I0_9PROT|nr:hypothetical protein [Sneathiella marina]USG59948.1 hypothetical protein NBZ79_12250 [Sneathiella marina]